MSLASILLRSRISSAMISSSSLLPSRLAALPPQAAAASAVSGRQSLPSPQIRCMSGVMMEVIRQVPSEDPNRAGELTFEDPDLTDARMKRMVRAEEPLRRKIKFTRHEKKWMKKKRLRMEKRYLRLKEGVEELKAYIQFKQDNKPDW
eukprot:CAMPEP_0172552828 /NCGR_PEP_ID=MMETSP1067-20121228/47218_1 /TAXON_ID=265564 ORGANISM="Thalassiosira punctigera, Strain Tpunct2005C2" /NCGR_SAMPLE_ID=MMETSP1067 /ASSEMBLY_ACC=CAM_ASM_000444 /LENGTH=147 /DNA_ID=CAMNT_0013340891 /DNA_START=52 /DNA_END=492 /DNA_ORIENTATION=+